MIKISNNWYLTFSGHSEEEETTNLWKPGQLVEKVTQLVWILKGECSSGKEKERKTQVATRGSEETYHTQDMRTDHSWVGAEVGKTNWGHAGKSAEGQGKNLVYSLLGVTEKPLGLCTCCFLESSFPLPPLLPLYLLTSAYSTDPSLTVTSSQSFPCCGGQVLLDFNGHHFTIIPYLLPVCPTRLKALWFRAFSGCSPLHVHSSAQLLAISKCSNTYLMQWI